MGHAGGGASNYTNLEILVKLFNNKEGKKKRERGGNQNSEINGGGAKKQYRKTENHYNFPQPLGGGKTPSQFPPHKPLNGRTPYKRKEKVKNESIKKEKPNAENHSLFFFNDSAGKVERKVGEEAD